VHIVVAERERYHGLEYQKHTNSVGRAIAWGVFCLVMTNEINLGERCQSCNY
jgi:hypothetical protein